MEQTKRVSSKPVVTNDGIFISYAEAYPPETSKTTEELKEKIKRTAEQYQKVKACWAEYSETVSKAEFLRLLFNALINKDANKVVSARVTEEYQDFLRHIEANAVTKEQKVKAVWESHSSCAITKSEALETLLDALVYG